MRRPIAPALTRRAAASAALLALAQSRPRAAHAADGCAAGEKSDFQSLAFGKENYASAVTASRDTNVSPKEAYDVIALEADYPAGVPCATALDLGAGAGVSTQILWRNGFRNIVAVDPSRVAWDANVVKSLPPGVQFVQASSDRYLASRAADAPRFDMVVVNYALNPDKALEFARRLLVPTTGRMLAPVNVQQDYWFSQEFRLLDQSGKVYLKQGTSGGWQVTFQPDFTEPNCQGQWCPQFRGASDDTLRL